MRIAYQTAPWAHDLAQRCSVPGVTLLPVATQATMPALAAGADALVLTMQAYTQALADQLHRPGSPVRWLQFMSAGYDTAEAIGVPDGVAVTNASLAWAPVVAEHAVALLLACLRQVPLLERQRAAASWDRAAVTAGLRSLEGAVVGILGYGTIGAEVARRLRPFGARLHGFARTARPAPELDALHDLAGLAAMLPALDVLVSALPLTAETRGFVGPSVLGQLRPSCVLVNIGRGPTCDEAALIAHLRDGRLAAAVLDVFEEEPLPPASPLWRLDNAILSPHVAAMGSLAARDRLAQLCCDNIARYAAGQPLIGQVPTPRAATDAGAAPGSR